MRNNNIGLTARVRSQSVFVQVKQSVSKEIDTQPVPKQKAKLSSLREMLC